MADNNNTPKNTLKQWFVTGAKPLQAQYWSWLDSYWHKSESIPINKIEGLETLIEDKADVEELANYAKVDASNIGPNQGAWRTALGINDITPPDIDLTNYYNKPEVDNLLSTFTVDLTGYATETFVSQAISSAISNIKDNTLEYPTFADFPQPGEVGNVYIDLAEDKLYIWDSASSAYISQSWNQTIIIGIQTQITALQNSKLDKGGYTGTAQYLYDYFEGKNVASYNSIPKVGNGASGKVLESSVISEIYGKIGINLSGEASEKLEVGGNIKAIDFKGQSIKFNLQASITPTPNTLVPKTDGSSLIWYNNSSIENNIPFLPYNWVFGLGSGSSYSNTAIGNYALANNTGGNDNTAIGYYALANNNNGLRNVAVGNDSQKYSSGKDNCSFGESSLVWAGSAVNNSVFGSGSGYTCYGDSNSAFGYNSLYFCTGENNVAIGALSAYNIGSGNKCVFIGAADSISLSTPDSTNMIAIGFNVAGKGSNTVELGNDSISNTYLKGKVNLNNRLKLASYTKAQRDDLTNKEVGDMIWQTDSGNSGIRVFDGTNWLAVQTVID